MIIEVHVFARNCAMENFLYFFLLRSALKIYESLNKFKLHPPTPPAKNSNFTLLYGNLNVNCFEPAKLFKLFKRSRNAAVVIFCMGVKPPREDIINLPGLVAKRFKSLSCF